MIESIPRGERVVLKIRTRKSVKAEQNIKWWKLRKEECCEDL